MIKHRRWYCPNCKREWIEPSSGLYMNSSQLTITGNRRNDLCPICGGPDIEYVEFQAAFPGGDIPRPESDPLPEGYEIEENWKPVERPQSIGFIQNNLIEMMSREKQ